ncbi:6-phosphogluconolactonase [Pontibacter russatus]|uniref:6-phosphogluconolactonase n=1 Tax=Pontibacter russatus TaxID=2694929 RepID=UPI00137B40D3|nr:6-phosphogluconolactonase [Pontibacter russatus]
MMVHIYKDTSELLSGLAAFFVKSAREAIENHGQFNVALSGGNSPKKLYELLASEEFRQQVAWDKVYFFFGDERYVPADDPENNARMAREAMFAPLHIPEAQIFKVDTMLPPEQAAETYEKRLNGHFNGNPARFDLILLGLGDDAHTASLFPGTPVLQEQAASVKAVFLESKQVYRISLTAPLINQAKDVAFLVYGAGKANAVQQVLEGERNITKYPAQLVQPQQGDVHWFLDEAAAALLRNK